MSYILEALRKSERERQLGQAPSLPVLVADAPPQRQRWLPWIVSILLLLTLNSAVLLYFGFGDKGIQPSETPKIAVAPPAQAVPHAAPKVLISSPEQPAAVPETPRQAFAEQEDAAAVSAQASSAASNERIAPKTAVGDAVQAARRSVPESTATLTPSPVADHKPLPSAQTEPNKLPSADKKQRKLPAEQSVERPEAMEIKRPMEKPMIPVLSRAADDTVANAVKREELPLLSAMPEDIRSRMPPLTVNMLAYSSLPKERFAVVNMVKYSSGDQLPGGAVLLEIRPDGLVLDLDGTRFRVPQR